MGEKENIFRVDEIINTRVVLISAATANRLCKAGSVGRIGSRDSPLTPTHSIESIGMLVNVTVRADLKLIFGFSESAKKFKESTSAMSGA